MQKYVKKYHLRKKLSCILVVRFYIPFEGMGGRQLGKMNTSMG